MFYNQQDLEKKFYCKNCNNRFDIPKFLPCGENMCMRCLNIIYMQQKSNNNSGNNIKFNCPRCQNEHEKPDNDFPTNRLLLEMLNMQIPKSTIKQLASNAKNFESQSFIDQENDSVTNAKASTEMENLLNQLKLIVNDLKMNAVNSEQKLKDNCSRICSRINQNTDNFIKNLNDIRNQMLNEVNNYENNFLYCLINKNQMEKLSIKKLLDDTDNQLNEWYKFLKLHANNSEKLRNEMFIIKQLEEKLIFKSDFIKNFYHLKEQLHFNDESVSLYQTNMNIKSTIIGELEFKKIDLNSNFKDSSGNDCVEQNSLNVIKSIEKKKMKKIDYKAHIEPQLKSCQNLWLCAFHSENNNSEENTDEYVIGMNNVNENGKKRYRINIKLINNKGVQIVEAIYLNCYIISMHAYQNKHLVVLAYENSSYMLKLHDKKLNLVEKLQLDFKPFYMNIFKNGIYVFKKYEPAEELEMPTSPSVSSSNSILHFYDWNLKPVNSIDINIILKKYEFLLKQACDLFILNDNLYLIDKLSSNVIIISAKNGALIKVICYKLGISDINNNSNHQILQHYHHQQQQQQHLALPPQSVNFYVQVNNYENIIVIDGIKKILFILDSKVNERILYKRDLSFIQTISSLTLINDYVLMLHDKVNKLIHVIQI